MRNIFVATRNVAAFRSALGLLEDTQKGQPGLGVIHGRAGRGKTLAAVNYHSEQGGIYLRVWQNWTQNAFLQALSFEAAGVRLHGAQANKVRIIEALNAERRTIFVDEADRLHPGRVEDLRDIHDETGCPVVLIGEEGLHATLHARRRLWSRVTQAVEFGPVSDEDVMVFALQAANLRLTPEAVSLTSKKAEGDFRLVYRLVQQLEQAARAMETDEITADMVRALKGGRA